MERNDEIHCTSLPALGHALEIIDKLRPFLQTKFQRDLFEATLISVQALENPLRLNNFLTGFRELVRDVFEHLAPNEQIKQCSWFVPDTTSATGVTRAHRVSFVIHGGLTAKFAEEEMHIDVLGEQKQLVKAVATFSKFTHVTPETFNLPTENVERYVSQACQALHGVLVAASDARRVLVDAIAEQIEEEVVAAVISETIMSVDEIASHHSVDEVEIDEIEVIWIGATEIQFLVHGSVGVELQWGSNSDIRHDNGAVMSESFPLSMKLRSSVDDPKSVEGVEDSLSVDTSDWYDDYSDHDKEYESRVTHMHEHMQEQEGDRSKPDLDPFSPIAG